MKTDEIVLSAADGKPLLKMFYSTAEAGNRRYTEHHHTELELSAIVSGSCEWQVRRRPIQCSAGDIMLLGSDEEHYITTVRGDSPIKLMNLQFEPRFIWSPGSDLFDARYLGMFLNHGESFDNRLPGDEATARQAFCLMEEIMCECGSAKPEYELIAKAKLMLLLGILGRRYSHMLTSPLAGDYDRHLRQLDEAVSYINDRLTEELSLEEIARSAGMSRSYFSTVFRQLNGIPVWSYITNKRIELALKYLRDTDMSVTEIAGRCGFNSMANFNRSFRIVTQTTPRDYRRR